MLLFMNKDENCDNAICEIAEGNSDALSIIYRNYGRMIYSLGFQITGNVSDAEDVLQEAMLKLLKQAHNYRKGTNPKAWVMSIARGCAIDIRRKTAKSLFLDEIECNAEVKTEDPAIAIILKDAMDKLKPEERTVINLKLYVGLSHKEIAYVLNTNARAAQKRYSRAMEKLKKYYDEQEENQYEKQ